MNYDKAKIFGYICAALLLGFAIGFSIQEHKIKTLTSTGSSFTQLRLNDPTHKLISSLLVSDVAGKKEFAEFKPFEKKVQDLISSLKSQGKITDLGFYFRDVGTGRWVAINEDTPFYPASLMKVPLMIAYFRQAEADPTILQKKLTYTQKDDLNQSEYTKPTHAITQGQSYTVDELITYMIAYSDNNATRLLSDNIDQNSFHEVYTDLGIEIPDSTKIGFSDYFTTKQYSLFLRILFNSTYLDKDLSEKALEILTKTDFKDGLAAGLPTGSTIAHKFGEFIGVNPDTSTIYELHDCGIIYNPNKPYLLCVMTKGNNRQALQDTLKSISDLVYSEVQNNYR